MVIDNLSFVIGERSSGNIAENDEFFGFAPQRLLIPCALATLRLCVERSFIRAIREIRGSLPLIAVGRAVIFCGHSALVAAGRAGHFARFRGKSMEVIVHEPFTLETRVFQAKSSQTQSNPVKPFFYFDRTMNRRP